MERDLALSEAIEQSGWPRDVVADQSRQGRVAESVEEFLDFVCFGDHSRGQLCVLRDGVAKLGLQASIPAALLKACSRHSSAIDAVLEAIELGTGVDGDGLDGYVFWWPPGVCCREEVRGSDMRSKLLRYREFASLDVPNYVAELRGAERLPHHRTAEPTSTLTAVDVKDMVAGQLPMWDRGHGFVGATGSGTCLHVDQAWWSNISKNFLGYKLVAVWGPGDASAALAACGGQLFRKPLRPEQHAALTSAATVALMQPGDVASFSGGLPHVTAVVGPGLNLMFYESFLNWNSYNAELLLRGADRPTDQHWWQNNMEPEFLKSVLDDVVKAAGGDFRGPAPRGGRSPSEVMVAFRTAVDSWEKSRGKNRIGDSQNISRDTRGNTRGTQDENSDGICFNGSSLVSSSGDGLAGVHSNCSQRSNLQDNLGKTSDDNFSTDGSTGEESVNKRIKLA